MRTGLVVFVLWAAACGNKESTDGSESAATGPAAGPAVRPIALATVMNGNARPASLAVYLGGKLVEIDPASLYGDPEKPFRGIDDQGRLTPASGAWRPSASPAPAGVATAVIVDRDTPAADVRAALAPLGDRCLGFLGTHDRVTAAVMPEPCPAPALTGEEVELAVWADKSKIFVGLSRVNEIAELATRALLEAALQQHKASAFFADRKDLAIAVHGDAKIGEVIELLDLAHGAGFTAARWVEPAKLPLEIADGIGTNPPRPPGTGTVPTVSIGQPNAAGDLDKAIIRRYIKRNLQKIMGCYEKRLIGQPGLEGTVAAMFLITPSGAVASSTASGVDPEIANCVAAVIKTIVFPKPKGNGSVQVNYPFTFRAAGP